MKRFFSSYPPRKSRMLIVVQEADDGFLYAKSFTESEAGFNHATHGRWLF
jgi:hypothetical protein